MRTEWRNIEGCIFFFSSRRRHTRYWRDWSSDVCSSDLVQYAYPHPVNTTETGDKHRLNGPLGTYIRSSQFSYLHTVQSAHSHPLNTTETGDKYRLHGPLDSYIGFSQVSSVIFIQYNLHTLIRLTLQKPEIITGLMGHLDRKSTRLNSSHANISYAVFCLKKKKNNKHQ